MGVPDPQDQVDIDGYRTPEPEPPARESRRWLSIWFNCCRVYGRIYVNKAGTRYEGPCPRCGARVGARIGPDGTSRRMFETT